MGKIVVAFDLYGTLLSTESIANALAKHFGNETAKSIAAVWRKYQLEYTWRLNSMKQYYSFFDVTRNSLKHTLLEHKLHLEESEIDEVMKQYDSLSIFPDVGPALERLRANENITCVVFSNGTKTMVTNSVKGSKELSPYSNTFVDLITMDSIKIFKPAPEVYQHLARSVGMEGQEDKMWLVSGNPFDAAGARAIGMQAASVNRAGTGWQDQLGPTPTVVVRGLGEVADIVEEHARKDS